jgi:molecular chaperone DnaJ
VRRKIQIRVPAGADNGMRLRVSGEGEAGQKGGPRGDLYVDLFVKNHEIFVREGKNIICEMPISFTQAALGCEIEVPTLGGMMPLKIPSGTQTGKVFKLSRMGAPSLDGSQTGDQEVRIFVETPTKLSDAQKELLKQFAEASGEKINPLSSTFVDKVRKLFAK